MVILTDKCKERGPGSGKWVENNNHSNVERETGADLLMDTERSAEADLNKTERN